MRNENDFYPTPHSIVRLLANYSERESLYVWEPCAGDFRLVEALQARDYKVIATDLDQGQDFFDFKEAPCPHFMTNPPSKRSARSSITRLRSASSVWSLYAQSVYGRAKRVGSSSTATDPPG